MTQQISDQEIDLRTFLARFLTARQLTLSLRQQVVEYGMLCAQLASQDHPSFDKPATPVDEVFGDGSISLTPTEPDEPEPAPEPVLTLSEDQIVAWDKLQTWVKSSDPYFILRGFAGTGKTHLMKMLSKVPGTTFLYSAPTNKASKVLGKAVDRPAKTTYSMLGLRMEAVEEEMVLVQSSKPPYIPRNAILVIDEGSMVSRILDKAVYEVMQNMGIRVLVVGDPAQLPPPKELRSKIWSRTDDPACRAVLKQVMRFDNQLLALSMRIRDCLKDKNWTSPILDDHDKKGGVYLMSVAKFEQRLMKLDKPEMFVNTKVVAWRNKTVDRYNNMIRENLGFTDMYHVGEQLMMAEPVQEDGTIVGTIDDEVQVTQVETSSVHLHDLEIPVYRLTVTGDLHRTLIVPANEDRLDRLLSRLASDAKRAKGIARKHAWDEFWAVKHRFHRVRYGYALTAHRVQGTTCETVFLDQMDILANPEKSTAFRCLYVGATRPTKSLYTY